MRGLSATMRVAVCTTALAVLCAVSFAHECVHDAILGDLSKGTTHEERHLATRAEQDYDFTVNEHGRALQSTWSPIRIKVDLSRLDPGV